MNNKPLAHILVTVFALAFVSSYARRDLSLTEAEGIALRTSKEIAVARAELQAVVAEAEMLAAPFNPMLSLNGYAFEGKGSMILASSVEPLNYAMTSRDGGFIGNASLMWRLYSGGRELTARRIGSAEIAAATAKVRIAENDVLREVRVAFAQSLRVKGKVEAAMAGVLAATEIERTTREMFEAGRFPEVFTFRAAAQTAKAQKELAMREAEYESALARLKRMLVLPQTDTIEPGDWDVELHITDSLQSALQMAAESRPEIAAANGLLQAAEMRTRFARQAFFPELSLMAMLDWMAPRGMPAESAQKVGFVVSFPLLDGGMRSSTVKEREAFLARSRSEFEQLELMVAEEVATAWAEWLTAPKLLSAASARVAAATEAFHISKLRYEEGRTIQAELTEVLAELTEAMADQSEAQEYQRIAWSNLVRAIGKVEGNRTQ